MTTPAEVIDVALANEAERIRTAWSEKLRPMCESPIEELYLAAVHGANIGRLGDPIHIYMGAYTENENRFRGDHLWAQAKIGPYRVDFLFEHIGRDGRRRVVVECDGHDFHEKTKKQAASDKARDRFLVSHGFQVLRFTGSEIFKDPYCCWAETLNVLWGLAEAA